MSGRARIGEVSRKTGETDVTVRLDLDGTGRADVATGVGFFDHMLDLLARHGLFDLKVKASGDLDVDAHHTVEDVGLALGAALAEALGEKRGVRRYGWARVPMDEALADATVDLSGRPAHVFAAGFAGPALGAMQSELVREFWKSVATAGRLNLHQAVSYGDNDHHKCEALFKATARALRQACEIDPRAADQVPSTKGTLVE